jgi:hypothetical protein
MGNKYKKFWEELIAYFPLIRHDSIQNEKTWGRGHRKKRDLISVLTKIRTGIHRDTTR